MISGLFSFPPAGVPQADAAPCASPLEHAAPFVAGPENALVRSVAAAVLDQPLEYNPLFLSGPIGVGKTTLAQALAARRARAFQLGHLITTTGDDLARGLAHAIETDSVSDFRAKHHRCDLLLIDDVDRLAGKAAAQQFLISTLDALVRRGSLVIVTAKSALGGSPSASLAPALVSRLTVGLVVPLAYPGPLAQRALVERYATGLPFPVRDDLVEQLTSHLAARQNRPVTAARLRHLVLQVGMHAQQNHGRLPKDALVDLLAEERPATKSVCRHVLALTGKHFGITLGELRGKSRQQSVADARGLAMYVARQLTGASYAEIGRHFGSRDHTTVLHACRKLAALVARDDATRRLAGELAAQATASTHP